MAVLMTFDAPGPKRSQLMNRIERVFGACQRAHPRFPPSPAWRNAD